MVFHLALTHGLEQDPIGAMERTVGLVEAVAGEHGVPAPVQGTFGITDGAALWAVRYASAGTPRTLFTSCDADAIRALHPENPRLQRLRHDDRVVVSEPLADLPGLWREVPASTAVIVLRDGTLEERPFAPSMPVASAAEALGG